MAPLEEKIKYHFYNEYNFSKGQKSRIYAYWFTNYMYAVYSSIDANRFKLSVFGLIKIAFYGILYFLNAKKAKLKKRQSLIHNNYKIIRMVFDTYDYQPIKLFYTLLLPYIRVNKEFYCNFKFQTNRDYLVEYLNSNYNIHFNRIKSNYNKIKNTECRDKLELLLKIVSLAVKTYLKRTLFYLQLNYTKTIIDSGLFSNKTHNYSISTIESKEFFNNQSISFRVLCNNKSFSLTDFYDTMNKQEKLESINLKKGKYKVSDIKVFNIMFHIHGGGFLGNTSHHHQNYLIQWANNIESLVIISINYKLLPEYTFEQQIQECFVLYYKMIHKNFEYFTNLSTNNLEYCEINIRFNKIIFTGDSAGSLLGMNMIKNLIRFNLKIPDYCMYIYPCK